MKYVLIEEVVLPGVLEMVPKAEWTDAEIEAGQSARTRDLHVNSGSLMVQMLVQPFERVRDEVGQFVTKQKAVDFARMRQVLKPLEVLDPDGDGVCELKLGTWVELDDAWWELIWDQAQIYPWAFTGRKPLAALHGLLARWEKVPDIKPLVLDELPVKSFDLTEDVIAAQAAVDEARAALVESPSERHDRWNPTSQDLVGRTLEGRHGDHDLIGSTD